MPVGSAAHLHSAITPVTIWVLTERQTQYLKIAGGRTQMRCLAGECPSCCATWHAGCGVGTLGSALNSLEQLGVGSRAVKRRVLLSPQIRQDVVFVCSSEVPEL